MIGNGLVPATNEIELMVSGLIRSDVLICMVVVMVFVCN